MIEIIAVLLSLFSAVYGIKKSQKTWTTGILGYIAYIIIFVDSKLYCNALLQIVFVLQSGWGYTLWKKRSKPEDIDKEYENSKMFSFFIILFMSLGVYFKFYTNNSNPILDASSTAASIVALYLMSYKVIQNWIWWIIADILYVIMFVNQHLYLSASLYLVFIVLCIIAYKKWKNEAK